MNRRILRLAIPNIISNITIPLLGLVGTAIAGSLGGDAPIAALGIGATMFGLIYWNTNFIRMGASGLTAQAFGARDFKECTNVLVRAVVVALVISAIILLLQIPIGKGAMLLMKGSDEAMPMVAQYFFARIWDAPATISIYAIQGWYIGMQNSRTPMYVSIIINLINIAMSAIFVFWFDMGIAGIGWGTVVAQYCGAILSWALWFKSYSRFMQYVDWKEALSLKPMLKFFDINKDIFLRTVFNVAVYFFIPMASTRYGVTMTAITAVMMQLFTLFSYISDGFGYAAEALTGRLTGARNFAALKHAIRNMFWWSGAVAGLFVVIYRLFWRHILGFMTDSPTIMNGVSDYIIYIIIVPLVAFGPFLMDGILVGASRTKIMRNSMIISCAIFFSVYYTLKDTLHYESLWIAFVIFITTRGIMQYFMTDRLRILYNKPKPMSSNN